jgi:tRNA A-37 threonylcarbamoyl transferase component Bud32
MLDTADVRDRRLAALRAEQADRWRRGDPLSVEACLAREPSLTADDEALLDLVYNEVVVREELGEAPRPEEYVRRFPRLEAALRRQFAVHRLLASPALAPPDGPPPTLPWRDGAGPASAAAPAGASDHPLIPGYEILDVVGRGGMGVVYKARDRRLNRVVALKVIRPDEGARPEALARFRAEAEAAARLQHPNVVQVFEVGEAGGRPFVALEYVAGGSLAEKLAAAAPTARAAAQMVGALARAVHHAHQQRIIHRDLKPANVLLTADGTPKITDFGLAKLLDDSSGRTRSGAPLGTPSYMPPEQAEGKGRAVGPSADVYALGAILYELLTGRPPFRAATPLETLRQVVAEEPAPPRRIHARTPRDLETICLKCLQKVPAKRYANAASLADDLARYAAGEPVLARPTPWWERAVKRARRRPAAAALLVVGATAAALLLGGWAAFTAQLQAAKGRAEALQTVAETERDRAKELLEIGLGVVEDHAVVVEKERQNEGAETTPGGVAFKLACSYARGSAAFRDNPKLWSSDRDRLAERHAAMAVKLLGCAERIGYFRAPQNVRELKENPDLAPLRARPEFVGLLARVEGAP